MKVYFLEDSGTKKKGDVAEYRDSYAELLISKGIAKKHTEAKKAATERKTKEEKSVNKKTK